MLPIPPLTARVTDLTQTLSPAENQAIEAKLADWESRTGNQLAVLMVPTTQPEPIESYSLRVAEAWKLGRKGNDNGALFLIAKNDRKMRIEVGYGLEGTLTDVTSRRIIAEDVAPLFREGKFAAGIEAGISKIINVVAEGKPLPPPKAASPQKPRGGFDFGTLLLILFIVVPVVGGILRSIFGKFLGSTFGAGIIGAAAWFVAGSLVVAIIAGIIAFIVMIFSAAAEGFLDAAATYPPAAGVVGVAVGAAEAVEAAGFRVAAAASAAVARRAIGDRAMSRLLRSSEEIRKLSRIVNHEAVAHAS
jgi:uncharacterized protein